jgi:hypothetical protein
LYFVGKFMNFRNAILQVISLLCVLASAPTSGATYEYERGIVKLSGKISKGDAESLVKIMISKSPLFGIELDSLGGDLNEAMKIVSLVKGAHYDTSVTAGGYCASSCFFIYLAGVRRAASGALPEDGVPPRDPAKEMLGFIGVHRPYFKDVEGTAASARKQEAMMLEVKGYLSNQGVSQSLIDEMMSRASNDIYWLSPKDIERIGEYAPGDQEALISKCGYKSQRQRREEKWDKDRRNALVDCSAHYVADTYMDDQSAYVRRLKVGWRPWSKGNGK